MQRGAMDQLAGIDRRRKSPTGKGKLRVAKPQQMTFTAKDAAAVMGIGENLFHKLVREGLVRRTVFPGSGDDDIHRYSVASLKAAVVAMTEREPSQG